MHMNYLLLTISNQSLLRKNSLNERRSLSDSMRYSGELPHQVSREIGINSSLVCGCWGEMVRNLTHINKEGVKG